MLIRAVALVGAILLYGCDAPRSDSPVADSEAPIRQPVVDFEFPEHVPPGYSYDDDWERCGWNADGSCPDGCSIVFEDIHGDELSALGYFCGRPRRSESILSE